MKALAFNAPTKVPGYLTLSEARRIIGSLGFPSKMPGTSYGLPARSCVAGVKLAKVAGSACSVCYALVGRTGYRMPRSLIGQERRLRAIHNPRWAEAMVKLLLHVHSGPIKVDLGIIGVRQKRAGGSRYRWNDPGFHRWHDSGDLQSVEHLASICDVARRTPCIRHWLPTQELSMVRRYLADGGTIPSNLVIRVSRVMIDDVAPRAWPQTSSIYTTDAPRGAHICPALQQDHRCMSCRVCWSADVSHVAYKVH